MVLLFNYKAPHEVVSSKFAKPFQYEPNRPQQSPPQVQARLSGRAVWYLLFIVLTCSGENFSYHPIHVRQL
jgi:hypothetical protein